MLTVLFDRRTNPPPRRWPCHISLLGHEPCRHPCGFCTRVLGRRHRHRARPSRRSASPQEPLAIVTTFFQIGHYVPRCSTRRSRDYGLIMATDVYRPDEWHDFFITVGGGAAVLTGLVFVALSTNLRVIVQDRTHFYRAIASLTGLAATFLKCGLVLMGGQDHRAVGAEILVVAAVACVVKVYGYRESVRTGHQMPRLTSYRTAGGVACYVAEIVGAAILIAGSIAGLYVAAVALMLNFYFMISAPWLLLVGASTDAP